MSMQLPSEVIVSLLLSIIVQEQGIASFESLLQAVPSLSHAVLLITDHDSQSPHALLKAHKVPHVSLDQYDSSPALRLANSPRLKVFSFLDHTNNLVTQKFNISLNCLYARHLSHRTPVLANVSISPEGHVFHWTLKSLAARAHVPVIVPLTFHSRSYNFISSGRSIKKDPFDDQSWTQYLSRLPPPIPLGSRLCFVTTMTVVQHTMIGYKTINGRTFANLERLNMYIRPASGLYHGSDQVGMHCMRPFVVTCCPKLKKVYICFKTCKLPCVIISRRLPHYPEAWSLELFFLQLPRYTDENFAKYLLNEERFDPILLDEFTLENKLWSIHYPFSNLCFYASSDPYLPPGSQAERCFDPIAYLSKNDFFFHSKKVSLIGVPGMVVFHRLQLTFTKEFSWWKLSPDIPVSSIWWDSLEPKQCPCLLKLKVFAVVRDREDDPPLVVDAPLLEEVQLVGLVTSENPWDLNQLLQNQEIHNASFLKAVKNKLSKRKVKKPPIPGVQLKKVMLGQYSTPLPLSVDWQQLSPAIETMESMAIVGYLPQFVLRKVTNYSTHPTFYCLRSFTLDVTWITQYTPTTTTIQVNLCERVYPSLIHLKLVVPQQSWYKFEGILYDDPCYHSFILKIEAPKRTKHITLSSVLLGITVNVNGCQLLKLNVGKPKYMNGVEYTWTKTNQPQVGFKQDLEFEGATFAEEWDFDNCIYDTYKPPAEPCKHLHRGLEEEI